MSSTNGVTLKAAMAYLRAGLNLLPVRLDKSKRPDADLLPYGKWKHLQSRLLTDTEASAYFGRRDPRGIGVICGKVSGNLETIDFDKQADEIFPAWRQLVEMECSGLLKRLNIVQTPREPAGYHVRYRCPESDIPGSHHLALLPKTDGVADDKRVLIETRGEGGYAIAPGSPGSCHETGREYVHYSGPKLSQVETITAAEREVLLHCARSFNQEVGEDESADEPGPKLVIQVEGDGRRPGDEYDLNGDSWEDIMEPHGWQVAIRTNWGIHLRRPGKQQGGASATAGYCRGKQGEPLLRVFSTNAPLFVAGKAYGRFRAYAMLNHGGDLSAAAKALARRGFGGSPPSRGNGACHGTTAAGELPRVESRDDPHRLGRTFLDGHRHDDGRTLHYWREGFHQWRDGAYREVPEAEIRARLSEHVKSELDVINRATAEAIPAAAPGEKAKAGPKPLRLTQRLVTDVVSALKGLCLIEGMVEQPSWLTSSPPFPAHEVLVCRNGLLRLPSCAEDRDCLHPLTPAFFSPNSLGYDFDPAAPEPEAWLGFLNQLWPEDLQSIETLQDCFGYLLTSDTSLQKIFTLLGPRRSGKGTIARVLRELIGTANVANPALASLGDPFGLESLLGKPLAIISDARLSGRTDTAIVVERLLSISGEDAQTVSRKFRSSITTTLPTRFLLISNEMPRLTDSAGALSGRLVLLRLTTSFYGREDHGLTSRLLTELPAILNWALEGWRRVQERHCFVMPESSQELFDELEELTSPISAFVRECCEVGPHCEQQIGELFTGWQLWCEEKGRERPGSQQTFGRDLRAAHPALRSRQPHQAGGRVRVYVGIRLTETWQNRVCCARANTFTV